MFHWSFVFFLCKGSIKTRPFYCHSTEETDKVLLMASKNEFYSKVWLLKISSDFNELLESFIPREIKKWQKLCKVLINERNITLVCRCCLVLGLFLTGEKKKKEVENKCVKMSG